MSSARDLVQIEVRALAEQLAAEQDRTAKQAFMLTEQRTQLDQTHAADQMFRMLSQTIARDGAVTRNALLELKKHDQAVAEYLRSVVPAAYGMQFERPKTTDPAEYRSGAAMPIGGLSSAGSSTAVAQ